MRQKLLNHVSVIVVVSIILSFIASSAVFYNKITQYMKEQIRNEEKYIRAGFEEYGYDYLNERVGAATDSRITLIQEDGTVIFDSDANTEEMSNHSDRPEIKMAEKKGYGEELRYSDTLSKLTLYYAVKLDDGKMLRISRTMDSIWPFLLSTFTLLGGLVIFLLFFEFFVIQKQVDELIKPINELNLENPLKNICYEEMRPLLMRVDQQNKQIERQVEELKAAEAMRREFSANVSHELKTPLMSISGYAELMMNGMVREEDVPVFSGRIYHEASRLTNLVADIIQLSRLDEKSQDLLFEAVDLKELTDDIVKNLMAAADKKHIQLLFEGEKVTVRGVRHVLYEMFYNLADNAVKYTNNDGWVKICVGRKDNLPFFQVEDNGIGIPLQEQGRIFERFYRVDKSHSRQTGGTGLGLSIVKHGAALHHVQINLESEVGKGTKMELIFSGNEKRSRTAK